jgi:hypothetical protein
MNLEIKRDIAKRKHMPTEMPKLQVGLCATLGNMIEATVEWIKNPGSGFAPHYVISREGEVVQTLNLDSECTLDFPQGTVAIALVNLGMLIDTSGGMVARLSGLPPEGNVIVRGDGTDHCVGWQMVTLEQMQSLLVLLGELREKFGNLPVMTGSKFSLGEAIPHSSLFCGFDPAYAISEPDPTSFASNKPFAP